METSTAQYWDARLDALDWKRVSRRSSRRSWARAYRSFLSPATLDGIGRLGELRGRRVLELGSGHGHGAVHLASRGARVTALDISPRRCAEGRRQLAGAPAARDIRFCAARAERLPFADASFDRVFARDVLMYADPSAIVRESLRVVAPGGRIVFVESLAGPLPLRLFRRWTSPAEYRRFTNHLTFDRLRRCGEPLEPDHVTAHYLLSLLAFAALFLLKSQPLHRFLLRTLYPCDRRLLRAVPSLSRWAWRGSVAFRVPGEPR